MGVDLEAFTTVMNATKIVENIDAKNEELKHKKSQKIINLVMNQRWYQN